MPETRIVNVAVHHQRQAGRPYCTTWWAKYLTIIRHHARPQALLSSARWPSQKANFHFFRFGAMAKIAKIAKCTFQRRPCALLMRTWGRARYLMTDGYLAHHVGQDDRPARLWRGTATATVQVSQFSAKMSQNEQK